MGYNYPDYPDYLDPFFPGKCKISKSDSVLYFYLDVSCPKPIQSCFGTFPERLTSAPGGQTPNPTVMFTNTVDGFPVMYPNDNAGHFTVSARGEISVITARLPSYYYFYQL